MMYTTVFNNEFAVFRVGNNMFDVFRGYEFREGYSRFLLRGRTLVLIKGDQLAGDEYKALKESIINGLV